MSQTPSEQPDSPTISDPANLRSRTDWRQTIMPQMEKSQQVTARWLYALGIWIFIALIVIDLVLLQDLISSGLAGGAALISGLAIALALPFGLVGMGIVYYVKHLNQATGAAKRKAVDSTMTLAFVVSMLLTFIGIGSALWRISWAVTLLFFIASVLGLLLALRVTRN